MLDFLAVALTLGAEARPINFYARALNDVFGAQSASGIIILTTTASPNLALACSRFEIPTRLVTLYASDHQLWHQNECAVEFFLPATAGSPVLPTVPPSLRSHPQYVRCDDIRKGRFLEFADVQPRWDEDRWCGLDLVERPLSPAFDLPSQEAKEQSFALMSSKVAKGKLGVFTSGRREEGSTAMICPAAIFTSQETLLGLNSSVGFFSYYYHDKVEQKIFDKFI